MSEELASLVAGPDQNSVPPLDMETNEVVKEQAKDQTTPKLPPCDQCRRRKVKCQQSKIGSCDRCVQSNLACTRDIQRKKRGPKKGSGSVIAKLRGEHENAVAQENLPAFNLTALNTQLARTLSDESGFSPISSPGGSQYGDDLYLPTPDPMNVPRSVPLGLGDSISIMGASTFSQAGMGFPAAWQIPPEDSLLQIAPDSPNGYLSVSDLAQQIFHEPVSLNDIDGLPSKSTSMASSVIPQNCSIDAVLNSTNPSTNISPSGTAASSPAPLHGPKALYRSNSGPSISTEPRLQAFANEIGMPDKLMSQCIKQFFISLYPIMPVVHEGSLRQKLTQPESLSLDDKVLLLSICGMTVTHAAPKSDLTLQDKHSLGKQFMELCFRFRHLTNFIEEASFTTIISSFFISITHFELKLPRSHHFYLREAIGLAREMRLDTDSEKLNLSPPQLICARRMMALLFITERGAAILRNKPISIVKLKLLPTEYFDEQDRLVLAGFTALCQLFALLDDTFCEVWQNDLDESSSKILENVATIQYRLNDTSFDDVQMTDIQRADVLITKQWLRLIFWQASMRLGLINSQASDTAFTYHYPIEIASDLVIAMKGMQYDSILVHGLGIFEKIFEVAYTLMDALTIAEMQWSTSEDLRYLFACLSASPNSHSTYVKFLENKMDSHLAQSPITQCSTPSSPFQPVG